MVQGTTPTLLFKFSVDLDLILEWRICFSQEGKENLIKTSAECLVDENKVIYVKLTQEETLAFDDKKILRIQAKALTKDNNVIPSQTVKKYVCEILDKSLFEIENNSPTIIDTSTIDFEFDTEPCGFGLDFEDLYIEKVSTGEGGNITFDKQLSLASENAVQNKVVAAKFNEQGEQINSLYEDFQKHKQEYESAVNVLNEHDKTQHNDIEGLKLGVNLAHERIDAIYSEITNALTELHNYAEALKGGEQQ